MAARVRVAEDVTIGHVDRLADALAERIVSKAVWADRCARTGVEVAIGRDAIVVTGFAVWQISMGPDGVLRGLGLDADDIAELAREVFASAGYVGPHAIELPVVSQLEWGLMIDEELMARPYSDDQCITVGYATANDALGHLPIEVVAVRAATRALHDLALAHPEVLGPDGKVLLGVRGTIDQGELDFVNVAIQHNEDVGYEQLYSLVAPAVLEALRTVPRLDVPIEVDADGFVINGRGSFVDGGARGDNGLSGKKLVCDLYGPSVPIGGGALAGKDEFKADRAGTFAARHLAVRLAAREGTEATVEFGWLPGASEPRHVQAELGDGRVLDRSGIEALVGPVDLRLGVIPETLFGRDRDWVDTMRRGYVGVGEVWDRP